jgi:hypothetical protein
MMRKDLLDIKMKWIAQFRDGSELVFDSLPDLLQNTRDSYPCRVFSENISFLFKDN